LNDHTHTRPCAFLPSPAERAFVFVYNSIFFSFAVDSREAYKVGDWRGVAWRGVA
jgi:hypothetical protein